MSVSKRKRFNGTTSDTKLTNIKLSSNKKLEEAISKANECYRLRFSLSRRLENCLLKDPNLTEEHCKGNLFYYLKCLFLTFNILLESKINYFIMY